MDIFIPILQIKELEHRDDKRICPRAQIPLNGLFELDSSCFKSYALFHISVWPWKTSKGVLLKLALPIVKSRRKLNITWPLRKLSFLSRPNMAAIMNSYLCVSYHILYLFAFLTCCLKIKMSWSESKRQRESV